jgi:hypothetical protein
MDDLAGAAISLSSRGERTSALTGTFGISYWPGNAVLSLHVLNVVRRRAVISAVVVGVVRAREDRMIQ